MPFVKGNTKKGGRAKGGMNKKTIDQKERAESLMKIIESNYLETDLKKLSSLQRCNLYLGLMEYVAPKLRRVDGNLNANISFRDEETIFE